MTDLGKLIVAVGVSLVVIGGVLLLLGRLQVPVGHLPGDIVYRRKNFVFYFPLMTSILISIVLSLVLYFVSRLHR